MLFSDLTQKVLKYNYYCINYNSIYRNKANFPFI